LRVGVIFLLLQANTYSWGSSFPQELVKLTYFILIPFLYFFHV
jgi:hypothetical protein